MGTEKLDVVRNFRRANLTVATNTCRCTCRRSPWPTDTGRRNARPSVCHRRSYGTSACISSLPTVAVATYSDTCTYSTSTVCV